MEGSSRALVLDRRPPTAPAADVLALGFGTTVAMWAIGYVGRLPAVMAPPWVLGVAMLVVMFGGGVVAGWATRRAWTGGMLVGALSAALNLLILGSVLGHGEMARLAFVWLPAFVATGAALGAAGAAVGSVLPSRREGVADWTGVFAGVAAAATFLLLVAGGIVTSEGAGLAVADWPNSFGYNMFLYPLSRMTGDIYFEHAHRLLGSLVGLTTLVLAIHLLRARARRGVRILAFTALGLVVLQGVLGGLRVTGHFTLATTSAAMRPSLDLAVVHGITGQLFFSVMVALAVVVSARWRGARPRAMRGAEVDRALGVIMPAVVLLQLVLGAVQRHMDRGLAVHIGLAMVVLSLVVVVGVRLLGRDEAPPTLVRLGTLLLVLVTTQVLLGFGALAALGGSAEGAWEVGVRTAHQATGALLFATAVATALWQRKLVVAPEWS